MMKPDFTGDYLLETNEECFDDSTQYVLTEWGILLSVLNDYGIDAWNVSGRVGKHIVEDFMEGMEKAGYILKYKEEEE